MIYYCDTEFTNFQGELISIALVPQSNVQEHKPFYAQVKASIDGPIHPWVFKNVVCHLRDEDGWQTQEEISENLRIYLKDDPTPLIIADWPEDLTHFWNLLITGPGTMIGLNNITTKLLRTPNWCTADHSKVPHHALHDAFALRGYFEEFLNHPEK
jgi:hypothetical protein